MKFGRLFSWAVAMVALLFASGTQAAGPSQQQTQKTLTLYVSPTGGGYVAAQTTSGETVGNYNATSSTATSTSSSRGGPNSSSFYCFAFPTFGYEFNGWGTTSGQTSGFTSTLAQYTPSSSSQGGGPGQQSQSTTYYACFSSGATVKDVYLAVGDTVQFYFYNSGSSSNMGFSKGTSVYWSARVNDTWLTSTTATDGSYATYTRSLSNTTTGTAFNMLVTASTESGDSYDQLTIQDYAGNVYHYRIHVVAAREVNAGESITFTANSFASKAWSVFNNTDSSVATASVSPTTATDAATVTVTSASEGSTTLTIQNYASSTTTGALGVIYTFNVKVNDPVFTYYAQVKTVVSGSVAGTTGPGWTYVSKSATEDSSIYQTTDVTSEELSATVHGTAVASLDVSGFYLYAFANVGYRFVGWSKNDLNGAIVETRALSVPVTVSSTSQDRNSPALDTYYAHFERDDSRVKDITLAIGDKVRLSFYNSVADIWSLQVVYTNQASNAETIVNPDSVESQSAGYANFTRSVANTEKVNEFSMLVEATAASGDDYDQLTIQDYAGNIYHYRVHVVDARYVEQTTSIDIPLASFATNTWSVGAGYDTTAATVSVTPSGATDSATVTLTGGKDGRVSFSVSDYTSSTTTGAIGAQYELTAYVIEPHPITFCLGDEIKIWYHNTSAKTWYLLINGVRYDAGVEGLGNQGKVTLYAENPTTDAYIKGVTIAAGDGTASDLAIATDGENFYGYRVTVLPRRTIEVGESVSVTCSTIATNAWKMALIGNAADYVDTSFESYLNAGHSAKLTITGKIPATGVTAYVYNQEANLTTPGAQGGVYTLVTDVKGAFTHTVYISKGVTKTFVDNYADAKAGTAYSVTPSSAEGLSATVAAEGATGVGTTLAAADDAAFGAHQLFTVWADATNAVVKYDVTAYSIMSMAVGQIAPGCLVGAKTPWVVWTSNADGLSIEAVTYESLQSGRIEAKTPGDYWIWATNADATVCWYAIRAQVYDQHEQSLSLATGATATLTIANASGLSEVWSATPGDLVSASLDNTTTAANSVTATITAGTTEGMCDVVVRNAFHEETIHVYVGTESGKTITNAGSVSLHASQKLTLTGDYSKSAWTAYSSDTNLVTVASASGASGSQLTINGLAAGTTTVAITAGDTIYVYNVEVLKDDHYLDAVTVGVGYTFTSNLTSTVLSGATVTLSGATLIADAVVSGNTLTITGLQEGRTEFALSTASDVYYLPVIVHERNLSKTITLYVGANNTRTTYSCTYDRIVSVENGAETLVTATISGTTLTLSPNAIGRAAVKVEGYLEGFAESSFFTYNIIIKQAESGFLVRDFDEGYLIYKDADEVKEVDGDLVFVYTNIDLVGQVKIPDGYMAKADILAVGGGGGGGSVATGFGRGGGGGGAGGFNLVENKKLKAGSFGVQLGAGGLGLYGETGLGISLKGSNGGDSAVTNAYGYVIALGNGGGGGGAPSAGQYAGDDGGSGGGGSWISSNVNGVVTWVPGRGGMGESGQGCSGGTPTETNCGAGGGGATGNGANGQDRGPGRYSTITGKSVLYSLGGYGGRSDVVTAAENGNGPGFGGDGGNGGPGGNGGNGEVVIRYHRLYQNVLVPIPTTNDLITARFLWVEGDNCVPFQYYGRSFRSSSNSRLYNWADAIESISGTTNIVCQYDESGTNKVGVGYYNFMIKLKDGFAWDDGSDFGNEEKLSYSWVVVEDWDSISAAIQVNKTVWWTSTSNATIRVTSNASPETSGGGTPKVLFLGTLCGAHGLSSQVLNTAINAVTAVGDIDCYLFNSTTTIGTSLYHPTDPPYFATNMTKGAKINYTFTARDGWSGNVTTLASTTGNHDSMNGFYRQIYAAITNGTAATYDYIIFSFDRARLAERFDAAFEHEAEVAEYLKSFYAGEKVIWLVDNRDMTTCTSTSPNITVSPWFPSELSYYNNGETLDKGVYYWGNSQNDETCRQWMNSGLYAYVPYNALVGLMCPSNYPIDVATYKANVNYTSVNYDNIMATACAGIENQCVYDNAANVSNLIAKAIKVKPFNLYYKDKIVSPAAGLEIQAVTIKVCTKSVNGSASTNATDWTSLIHWDAKADEYIYDDTTHATGVAGASMSVDLTNNLVTACLSNISFQVWVRYDTEVLDVDGKFRTSEGASYNESTGQYEKNPNDGSAYVAMVDDLGVAVGVEGDAETETPWRYTAYLVTGIAQNGSAYVNGTRYSMLSCAEGNTVTVYYRGNGGYRLASLKVDNQDIQIGGEYDNRYTFTNLSAPHVVSVVYTPYYGTIDTRAVTNQYDGAVHFPKVTLAGWDETFATETRYSLTEDGDYYSAEEFAEVYGTNRAVTCVGDHELYCRVFAFQVGYGETLNDKGWVWVDTRVVEKGVVTITPKPLVMTANSFYLSGDDAPLPPLSIWEGVTIDGLVAGDTVNTNADYLTFSCPDYQRVTGQYMITPVKVAGKTDADLVGDNYTLYFRPGVVSLGKSPMVIGGVEQSGFLDPEDPYSDTGVDPVLKVYDGKSTNLVVRIDMPPADDRRVLYSYDDGASWTSEVRTFSAVGTNRVWYAVEQGDSLETSVYFWVTNYNYIVIDPRPISITAASATKRYDGAALAASGYELTEGTLADGDTLVGATVTGSQTVVGSSANVASKAVIRNGSAADCDGNYSITYIDGTLTVTPGAIHVGDTVYTPGEYVEYGKTGVEDVEKTYDGIGTNINVKVTVPASGYRVFYSTNTTADADWTWASDFSLTNVGEYAVHFMVQADNYATVTNTALVKINPVELTVTVQDATMRGLASQPAYQTIVTYTDSGEIVPDEVASQLKYVVSAVSTNGLFTIGSTYSIVAIGATVQGNYRLNFVPGTLTVHNKLTLEYTASNVVVPYDGLGHSVAVSCTNLNSVIRFSTSTNGPWSSTPPVITNATSGTKIYYQINAGDAYEPVSGVVVLEVTALKVTVTAGDAEIWEYDPLPTLTAKVSGVLAGESTNLISYVLSASDLTAGEHPISASGATSQGNYTVSYVNGKLKVKSWTYPAGPKSEIIPIDRGWVITNGSFGTDLRYAAASNFFYTAGANGVTNWMNYVLGLDPTNVKSVIYLDIEPNLSAVTQPTLVARGAKVRPMSIGSLTNVSFRLLKSTSPTGTYEKVEDALDGRFPQQNVPIEYFRIDTRFLFESK